jgi:uncharacterized membrane protein YfcA
MKKTLKISVGYIVGVFIGIVAMSLWRNEEIDWQLLLGVIAGGFIGILIVSGITMYIKKEDKTSE